MKNWLQHLGLFPSPGSRAASQEEDPGERRVIADPVGVWGILSLQKA